MNKEKIFMYAAIAEALIFFLIYSHLQSKIKQQNKRIAELYLQLPTVYPQQDGVDYQEQIDE